MFLPLTVAVYYLLHRYAAALWARVFLLASSLGFVSFWNFRFALVLMCSVCFNYVFGQALSRKPGYNPSIRKRLFVVAIIANILYLGFFKYSNFFLENINTLFSTEFQTLHMLLPIGISFYTFMQIAWLTDTYRRGGFGYDFLGYCQYVAFFPYVISGPIAYHGEVIPQLQSRDAWRLNTANLCRGVFIFSIGLFKKSAIADTLAMIANGGFDAAGTLTFTEAWLTSLSYTMQLYFDFSGYTDMAIGAALMFNIDIPANFNSPYRSLNIREFWRRWHITLSRFLRDYIYIPLGGNRHGEYRTLTNLMLTFLIGGLWHGAAWTFVFWGFLHGAAMCIHRLWMKTGIRMSKAMAFLVTFNFINIAWVFFRARDWDNAISVLRGMAGMNGILVSANLAKSPFWQKMAAFGVQFGKWRAHLPDADTYIYFLCILLLPLVLMAKNSNELLKSFQSNRKTALAASLMILAGLLLLNDTSSFLYFNF